MSAKVIKAVNAMVANADKIAEVTPTPADELIFKYDNKYVWGVLRREGEVFLYFYPNVTDVNSLGAALNEFDQSDRAPSVRYSTKDIGTREAADSFKELHLRVSEKLYGVDKVLDDIIDEDDIPF